MSLRKRQSFEAFVVEHGPALYRTAFLLTGDPAEAEDLLQEALTRTYRRWNREVVTHPAAYVRQAMVNLMRNRWRRRVPMVVELTTEHETTIEGRDDASGKVEDRDRLARALATLSPRQRAVVVLRYWDDVSEEQTARMLGCSVGSVKSHGARGLHALRRSLTQGDDPVDLTRQPVAAALDGGNRNPNG
jgi:RNA polymerase sigma-70 factor (sigma-E family)